MIKGSCDVMGRGPSRKVTILQRHPGIVVVVRFLMVKEQDSTCASHYLLSLKNMTCHAHTHQLSGRWHNNLPVNPVENFRYWSHMSTITSDRNYIINFCHFIRKQ